MLGFYTPFLLLQAFCVYHAYRNNADYRWYWLILLFPGAGCLIYLFHHFYNRNNVYSLKEGLKEVVNTNYKIEKLEKALRFSDTVANRMRLAEAYVEYGRYGEAAALYRECLTGFMSDDPTLRMKLLHASFLNEDYENAIELGKGLEHEKAFKNAEERMAYAWALHFSGNSQLADATFRDMDRAYTNYRQRTEYCKFLIKNNNASEAKIKLADILEELDHMTGPERRFYRSIIREINDLSLQTR
jgi:hypothetical protein